MTTTTALARALAPLTSQLPPADLELVIDLAVLIAHADLHIDDAEREALRNAMETTMRSPLAPAIVNGFIGTALANIRAVGGEAYAERLGALFAERKLGAPAYRAGALVALASEGVSSSERAYLRALARGAQLDAESQRALDAEAAEALLSPT